MLYGCAQAVSWDDRYEVVKKKKNEEFDGVKHSVV